MLASTFESLREIIKDESGISLADGKRDAIGVASLALRDAAERAALLGAVGGQQPSGGGGHRAATALVVECAFARSAGAWRIVRPRADKPKPNSVRSAWSTLEAVAEQLTLDQVEIEVARCVRIVRLRHGKKSRSSRSTR